MENSDLVSFLRLKYLPTRNRYACCCVSLFTSKREKLLINNGRTHLLKNKKGNITLYQSCWFIFRLSDLLHVNHSTTDLNRIKNGNYGERRTITEGDEKQKIERNEHKRVRHGGRGSAGGMRRCSHSDIFPVCYISHTLTRLIYYAAL